LVLISTFVILDLAPVCALENYFAYGVLQARTAQHLGEQDPGPLRIADRAALPLRPAGGRREESAPIARAFHRHGDGAQLHLAHIVISQFQRRLNLAFDL
jgi:hypothetical protein